MAFYILLLLFVYSFQGSLAGPPVEVTPERIILLENKPLEVRCRVRQPIAYCRFDVPGIPDGLSLRPGIPPHQGIQYLGAGLEQGECGMLIQGVSSKHSGIIKCSMGFNNEPTESKGNLTLIVARPPDPPILQVYPGNTYRDAFREGEVIQANCRIINARPVANISWYLGAEPIYDRLGPTVIEEENGFMSISQNMSRKVTFVDHGKDLKCVAGHIALGQGNINHSIYKLNVRFPPKPKSQELEKFGFAIGQPGKIVVTFQANPIPDIVWKVDQDSLKQGTRDRTGRFEAGILQHKGAGMWDAVLRINTVRPEEVEKRYTLIAQNELGHESYKVAISTSPEPPADITAGTIVGIVIAVLIILLLVFILIFARATGRWCFAGGIPRPPGESHPSFRWFQNSKPQRNPSKVHSLIYKDYTLVEHEDGTKTYVSPEDKTRLDLEGKLKSSKVSLKPKDPESDSDTEYEVPVLREKPKSLDFLDQRPKVEMMRYSSYPGEMSPGDNGRINLPPYIVPVETSLTLPMTKKKKKEKKKKNSESSSAEEDGKKRVSFLKGSKRISSETDESPEDAEVREITTRFSQRSSTDSRKSEDSPELELPVEVFPESLPTKRYSHGLHLPTFPKDPLRGKERRQRNRNSDPNPLRKMFGMKGMKKLEGEDDEVDAGEIQGRYSDATLSQIQSDTESADHGSADKSSVSKLTSEKQPRRLMSLFGSFKKGRKQDRVGDNEIEKNPASFEITVKEEPEENIPEIPAKTDGIVYAELDMARTPGNVMRRDDEKTEYAEIIYPGSKLLVEKTTEEMRKSRENLTSSRENLTEVDEAYTTTPDGKKEATV